MSFFFNLQKFCRYVFLASRMNMHVALLQPLELFRKLKRSRLFRLFSHPAKKGHFKLGFNDQRTRKGMLFIAKTVQATRKA